MNLKMNEFIYKLVTRTCLSIILIGFISSAFLMGLYLGLNYSDYPKHAPSNYLNQSQIHLTNNSFCVDVENPSMTAYASTGSMIPTIDENTNGIRITPKNESEINVGDLITYIRDGDMIIHRVIKIGHDEEGWYAILLGDNNQGHIDGKVRFSNITKKTIALIY